jgi:sulfite reductase (NADPH) hemoprotein beta-component
MSKTPSPQIVIASELSSGRVVFLAKGARAGSDVRWARLIDESELAETPEQAAGLLALAESDAAARHEVLDPYLIDVEVRAEGLSPTKYREAIRCLGPTVRLDLGKQAEGASA